MTTRNWTTPSLLPIDDLRAQFPGLSPDDAALDGAAGTQVPAAVIDAIADALRSAMANTGGAFAASRRSTELVVAARSAIADLVGGVPEGVILGPNMTTLTFHLADALSRTWASGDEVVVTSLDHDANVRPWRLAAQRAGATVRVADFDVHTGELPVEAVEQVITERTKLLAVTAASNAIGTRPHLGAIADAAHAVGAVTYVDGVHATPHVPVDLAAWGADFYACSSYKFCGPHTGAVTADPALLEQLQPAKLIPSSDRVPNRFERGTPPFELLAGVRAAVDWLAGLTDAQGDRRTRLLASFTAIETRLQGLLGQLVAGLSAIDGVRLLGSARQRTSTVSFLVDGFTPQAVAERLSQQHIAVWDGDNYAYELIRRYGLSNIGGAVRASIVLYNTSAEIDRLVRAVATLAAERGDEQRDHRDSHV
ncbi:MAG TPA: cysteine desulfurase-like protein [Jatrophihabitans sp.]|jgi:cysteine desulfurase family protein (TIGR01976 family)|nr:cysteine desulfurase-like protein [Jatrophihabitans sp.]